MEINPAMINRCVYLLDIELRATGKTATPIRKLIRVCAKIDFMFMIIPYML